MAIPARWGSTRLPGKPLRHIAGRPLLVRTIDTVRRGTREIPHVTIVVVTDDDRVEALASMSKCEVIRTDPAINSGSARVLAAARTLSPLPKRVINVQGDAPFVPPAAIAAIYDALVGGAAVATPVIQLDWAGLDDLRQQKQTTPFSGTTCVVADNGDARWFSKHIIPAMRDEGAVRQRTSLSPVFRHVGLYGYTVDALTRFEAAPPSPYELLEGLEQLRFFDLNIAVRTIPIDPGPISMSGIDTEEDIALAERLILRFGDPYGS